MRHIAFINTDINREDVNDFELDTNEVTELKWVEIGNYKSNIFIDIFNIDFEKLEGVGKWAFKHKGETIHLFEEYCKRYGIELKIKNRKK